MLINSKEKVYDLAASRLDQLLGSTAQTIVKLSGLCFSMFPRGQMSAFTALSRWLAGIPAIKDLGL